MTRHQKKPNWQTARLALLRRQEKTMRPPLRLGKRTRWGKIAAVGITGGERYYWMVKGREVAMMPAEVVEEGA